MTQLIVLVVNVLSFIGLVISWIVKLLLTPLKWLFKAILKLGSKNDLDSW